MARNVGHVTVFGAISVISRHALLACAPRIAWTGPLAKQQQHQQPRHISKVMTRVENRDDEQFRSPNNFSVRARALGHQPEGGQTDAESVSC